MTVTDHPLLLGIGHRFEPHEVAALFDRDPPFASVYVRTPSTEADAQDRFDIRRRNARRALHDASHHVDPEVIDAIDAAMVDLGHAAAASIGVLADRTGVIALGRLPHEVPGDLATVTGTPRLLPFLAAAQRSLPHIVVRIDRTGADLYGFDHAAPTEAFAVEGDTEHIHRGHPGGWSQRRFQQRAENTWRDNAAEVAAALSAAIDDMDPAFVVVAGDVRARGFLLDHLSSAAAERVHLVDGGRTAGGTPDDLAHDVGRVAATIAAGRLTRLLAAHREGLATGDAVEGADDTFRALRRGQVEALLVVDDTADDEPVLDTTLDLSDTGDGSDPDPRSDAPRTDRAVQAAFAHGATVHVVPASGAAAPADGLGARLRFRLDPDE